MQKKELASLPFRMFVPMRTRRKPDMAMPRTLLNALILAVSVVLQVIAMVLSPHEAGAITKWPKTVHMVAVNGYGGPHERWQMKEYPPSKGGHAMCMDPPLGGVSQNSEWTVKELKDVVGKDRANKITHALYFGPGGPGYNEDDSIWTGNMKNASYIKRYSFVHGVLGLINGYGHTGDAGGSNSSTADKYVKATSKRSVPSAFVVKVADFNGPVYYRQRYCLWFNDWKKLTIKKKVSGTGASTTKKFSITVTLKNGSKLVDGIIGGVSFKNGTHTFELKDGESATVKQIPPGYSYSVSEDTYPEYETTISDAKGKMTSSDNVKVTVKNHKESGTLKVTKRVTGRADGKTDTTKFTFTATITDSRLKGKKFDGRGDRSFNASGKLVLTHTLASGETWTIDNLPSGASYEVSETKNPKYELIPPSNAKGTVVGDTVKYVRFTNNYNVGDLKLSKKGVGLTGSLANQTFQLDVTVKDKNGNGIVGKYGNYTFKAGGIARVTLKAGETKTITNLPAGASYSVREVSLPDDVEVSYTNQTGKIKAAVTSSVTVINTGMNSFVVSKFIADDEPDANATFEFTMSLKDGNGTPVNGAMGNHTFQGGLCKFSLKHGDSEAFDGIPNGYQYEVTETNAPGYIVSPASASGTFSGTKRTPVKFTNRSDKGSISINKTALNDTSAERRFQFSMSLIDQDGGGVTGTFPATLTTASEAQQTQCQFSEGRYSFTLSDGETLRIDGIPDKTRYDIEEVGADAYDVQLENASGTVTGGKVVAMTATNTRKVGELTIMKKVVNPAVGDNLELIENEFQFRVRLTDGNTPVSGTLGGVTFTDGTSEPIKIRLREGDSRTLTGLPVGCSYEVIEEEDPEYVATIENATGTIAGDDPVIVTAINTVATGNLSVHKTVIDEYADAKGPDGNDLGPFSQGRETFGFIVSLHWGSLPVTGTFDGTVGDASHQFSFDEDGFCEFELKSDETAIISGIPTGCAYEVTERSYPAYTTESDGDEGSIEASQISSAEFRNIRKTGLFKLHKSAKESE